MDLDLPLAWETSPNRPFSALSRHRGEPAALNGHRLDLPHTDTIVSLAEVACSPLSRQERAARLLSNLAAAANAQASFIGVCEGGAIVAIKIVPAEIQSRSSAVEEERVIAMLEPHLHRSHQNNHRQAKPGSTPVKFAALSDLTAGLAVMVVSSSISPQRCLLIGLIRCCASERFSDAECRVIRAVSPALIAALDPSDCGPVMSLRRSLPPRMRSVLSELLRGASRKQIAARLQISTHTVGDYVKAIYCRLGVNSRGQLMALFLGHR